MQLFSSEKRADIHESLSNNIFDLLIIGGGITGAGIALDAVSRGLRVGLIEMQDFAAGTSSRSTKLVHGGLRYLKQFEIKIVAEVGKEREIVYENGPHVTTPEYMMLPFYKNGNFGPFTTNIGLRVYDFLAGVKKRERRQMLTVKETLNKEPLINEKDLKGAGYYVEYKTDDARLTMEVLKKAVEKGVIALNYVKATDLVHDQTGKLTAVIAEDQITHERYEIIADKIINATGPWVDEVRELDGSNHGKSLHLTKGIHLVFSKERFPLQQAIYFDAPDGRMIFAIPRNNTTYIGTTDTDYDGDIAHPLVTKEDRDYILTIINQMFPELNMKPTDVKSSWAGVRPLIAEVGKKPGEISRKDEIFIAESGLISMAGGKLTGYRKMAEQVVDQICAQLKKEKAILYSKSETAHLPISGGEVNGSKGFLTFKQLKLVEGRGLGLTEQDAEIWIQTYGANVDYLFANYANRQVEAVEENIDSVVFAELLYAIEYELAYKPADFFVRRTGALFFNIDWVKEYLDSVTSYMAKVLKWTEAEKLSYVAEMKQFIAEAEVAY